MQLESARLTWVKHPHAPTVTTRITPMRARLTATTALSGFPAASSSVLAPGSTATVAASTGVLASMDAAGLSDGLASRVADRLAGSMADRLHACQLDADSLTAHFVAEQFAVEQFEVEQSAAVAGSMVVALPTAGTGKFIQ